jgi:hypothetical protein
MAHSGVLPRVSFPTLSPIPPNRGEWFDTIPSGAAKDDVAARFKKLPIRGSCYLFRLSALSGKRTVTFGAFCVRARRKAAPIFAGDLASPKMCAGTTT